LARSLDDPAAGLSRPVSYSPSVCAGKLPRKDAAVKSHRESYTPAAWLILPARSSRVRADGEVSIADSVATGLLLASRSRRRVAAAFECA